MVVLVSQYPLGAQGKVSLATALVVLAPYVIWMLWFRDGADSPRRIDWLWPVLALAAGFIAGAVANIMGWVE